jgi:hypothetical protein
MSAQNGSVKEQMLDVLKGILVELERNTAETQRVAEAVESLSSCVGSDYSGESRLRVSDSAAM